VLAGLLVFAAGLGFSRCQIEWIDAALAERKRLREAIEALPDIASHQGERVLFFGSSLVWNGFSPVAFDERLRELGVELDSFNFGHGGLNPGVQLTLARRVRRAHEATGRRFRLTLVEFNPFQATRARGRGDARVLEQNRMMLATPEELRRMALESPERAARYFASRMFRKSISPESVTGVLGYIVNGVGQALEPKDPHAPQPDPAELELRRARSRAWRDFGVGLFRANRGFPAMWSAEVRGGWDLDVPETHDALSRLSEPTDWDLRQDLEHRIGCCDIEELRFDDELVDAFVALVPELAAISDRVEIVLMPVNHAWVKRTAGARERLRDVVARLRRETRVAIVDLSDMQEIESSDFWDVTHLSFTRGAEKFSRLLADRYAPSLRDTRAR
jgi:hypothetical protein